MVRGKGKFPFHVSVSKEALDNCLIMPPIWPGLEQNDYDHACAMWQALGCRNLGDYMLAYMKLDVYLLADVFQKFRAKSYEEDGLEALRFFSIPGLSWASAIKSLKKPLALIQDAELHKFFEGGVRGGMTFVNRHHAKADKDTQLLYIDINNLYGWSMTQKLPCKNIKAVDSETKIRQVINLVKNKGVDFNAGSKGYCLEVDLDIPDHLHDRLDDLPVAPVTECPPGSKVKKLMLTHEPKKNYVIHCRLLQHFLSLGVVLTKVHRVVEFDQDYVFADYVNANTEKRKKATTKFDRDYYKLKNNSLYGKTIENLKKRRNLRLCNNPRKLVRYASSPLFRKSILIAGDLAALLMCKETIVLDRPSYIGQVILDLSKLRMYELQYTELEKYRREFNCEINIVAGDTDSFFLECKHVDLRTQLLPAMITDGLLDTSKYDPKDSLFSMEHCDTVGKFKDEGEGKVYKEWMFLRPKCYSLLTEEEEASVQKAKGVNLRGTSVNHDTYMEVYENNTVISVPQSRFVTKNHQIFTQASIKVALRCLDDKRSWTGKNTSHAYGHYSLPFTELNT
jgi:hypothetical protein